MFSIGVGSRPCSIAVGDFNDDTHLDVVYSYNGQNAVSMLFGYGNGTLGAKVKFFFETASFSWSNIAVGDFNDDDGQDIVTANVADDTMYILLNTCECYELFHNRSIFTNIQRCHHTNVADDQ